jgi:RNA recognition motif-containing protein
MHPYIGVFFPLEVIGAKVVTNARSPGARCYGFVTMSTSDEATKCISHLHRTELHGRMISVEKVRCLAVSALAITGLCCSHVTTTPLHSRPRMNPLRRSRQTGEHVTKRRRCQGRTGLTL